MAEWRAHLQGEQFDLQELKEILLGHDPSIIQDGGSFYLRSKQWDQLNDAGEIHNRAKEFIQALENAAYLHFRDTAPLTIGGVIKIDDDGCKHHFVSAEVGAMSLARVRATATVMGPNNQALAIKQEHPLIKILRASAKVKSCREIGFQRIH